MKACSTLWYRSSSCKSNTSSSRSRSRRISRMCRGHSPLRRTFRNWILIVRRKQKKMGRQEWVRPLLEALITKSCTSLPSSRVWWIIIRHLRPKFVWCLRLWAESKSSIRSHGSFRNAIHLWKKLANGSTIRLHFQNCRARNSPSKTRQSQNTSTQNKTVIL